MTTSIEPVVLYQTENYRLEFSPEYDKTNSEDGPYKVYYIPTNNVDATFLNYASAYEIVWRFEDGLRQIDEAMEKSRKVQPASSNVTRLLQKPN